MNNRTFVIHPFLLAVHPIILLYSKNVDHFNFNVVYIPLAISLLLSAMVYFLLFFFIKDAKKTGLLFSLTLVLILSYGDLHSLLGDFQYIDLIQLSIIIILFSSGTYFIFKTKADLGKFTKLINITAVFLLILPLIEISSYAPQKTWRNFFKTEGIKVDPSRFSSLPDIYYIIFDGYGRADILQELYQKDNHDILDYLEGKGFYLAHESTSNYVQTGLSLSSSMNFDYLNNLKLAEHVGIADKNKLILREMIRNNRLFSILKKFGYQTVSFRSGYYLTEIIDSDIYVEGSEQNEFQIRLMQQSILSSFQIGLIGKTFLAVYFKQLSDFYYDWHREVVLYPLEHIADYSGKDKPTFVFVHIGIPHPPFIFGPNGENIYPNRVYSITDGNHFFTREGATREEYLTGYKNQVEFTNKKIKEIVEKILAKSSRDPVIVIQGDHGPGFKLDWEHPEKTYHKERFSILNAYYLPEGGSKLLYPEISPVNTFRVILNYYLGMNFKLLKDECYFSSWSHPYKFFLVKKTEQ